MEKKEHMYRLVEERLSRISSDIEVEMMRLIKTQSFISLASNILKEGTGILEQKSQELCDILDALQGTMLSQEKEDEKAKELRARIERFKKEIEDISKRNLSKLSSLHEFYSMEIEEYKKAIQEDLEQLRGDIMKEIVKQKAESSPFVSSVSSKEKTQSEPEGSKRFLNSKQALGEEDVSSTGRKRDSGFVPDIKDSNIGTNDRTYMIEDIGTKKSGSRLSFFIGWTLIILILVTGWGSYFYYFRGNSSKKIEIVKKETSKVVKKDGKVVFKASSEDVKKEVVSSKSRNNSLEDENDKTQADVSTTLSTKAAKPIVTSYINDEGVKVFVLDARAANLRKGPGKRFPVINVVKAEDKLFALGEERGRWIKVRTEKGENGWIAKGLLKESKIKIKIKEERQGAGPLFGGIGKQGNFKKTASDVTSFSAHALANSSEDTTVVADVFTINSKGANLRTGPGTKFPVVTVIKPKEKLFSLGEETKQWIKVKTEKGTIGWVAKSLLRQQ